MCATSKEVCNDDVSTHLFFKVESKYVVAKAWQNVFLRERSFRLYYCVLQFEWAFALHMKTFAKMDWLKGHVEIGLLKLRPWRN